MQLLAEIRKQVITAMKAKDTLAKDVLRVAQGDIELTEMRQGKALTEEQQQQIVRKLIKSNQETLVHARDEASADKLNKEILILEALLPRTLGVAEIIAALTPQAEAIKAAGNDGQATGVAMKHLKQSGLAVDGKDVSEAVRQLRNA